MSALPALEQTRPMQVKSDILGDQTVSADAVLDFPAGLFGLPDCHGFVLLPAEQEGLYWLQSTEHSALTFVLVDPFVYFPGYEVDVPPAVLEELDAKEGQVAVLCIVTLPLARAEKPTANLQGPLVLHPPARKGRQLALQDDRWGVRVPLELGG